MGSGVALVAQRVLSHGVTSFCPTLVTSPPEVYHKVRSGPGRKSRGPRSRQLLTFQISSPLPTNAPGHLGLTLPGPWVLSPGRSQIQVSLCLLPWARCHFRSVCCSCPHRPPHVLPQHLHLPHAFPTLHSGYFQAPESASWIKATGTFPLPHPWPLPRLFPS